MEMEMEMEMYSNISARNMLHFQYISQLKESFCIWFDQYQSWQAIRWLPFNLRNLVLREHLLKKTPIAIPT